MKTYYDLEGKTLGRAWGVMRCTDSRGKREHKPHSHDPEFAMYGPYMCEGYPKIDLYDTPIRKKVNR